MAHHILLKFCIYAAEYLVVPSVRIDLLVTIIMVFIKNSEVKIKI